jgi:hypothetical protein
MKETTMVAITRAQAIRLWYLCGQAMRAIDDKKPDKAWDCLAGMESWLEFHLGGVSRNEMEEALNERAQAAE